MVCYVAIALLLVLCFLEQYTYGESLSTAECEKLGFNSLALRCETCDTIARIIGEDDQLEHECLRCCSNAEEDQFEMAILEVDKRMIPSFPNIPDIIKALPVKKSSKKKDKDTASVNSAVIEASKKLADYDLSVSYRFGVRPQLNLYKSKDSGEADKTIYVGTWNMDDFVDFVGSKLKLKSS